MLQGPDTDPRAIDRIRDAVRRQGSHRGGASELPQGRNLLLERHDDHAGPQRCGRARLFLCRPGRHDRETRARTRHEGDERRTRAAGQRTDRRPEGRPGREDRAASRGRSPGQEQPAGHLVPRAAEGAANAAGRGAGRPSGHGGADRGALHGPSHALFGRRRHTVQPGGVRRRLPVRSHRQHRSGAYRGHGRDRSDLVAGRHRGASGAHAPRTCYERRAPRFPQ